MNDYYRENPLVHQDRRLSQLPSEWVRSFACEDMRILVVCRGPVRKEAVDTFREMGVARVGMLLSEKDSIVYTNAIAPELRFMSPDDVHRVEDYTGANRQERAARVQQIIDICKTSGYEYVFAGYGFMAEDEDFVAALEAAGVNFVGPCSYTVRSAGRKDEAKRTALQQQVSVTPGVQDLTARTLVGLYPSAPLLLEAARANGLEVEAPDPATSGAELLTWADAVLEASYQKGIDLISIEQISAQIQRELTALFREHPGRRIRLKAIGGGGGKGQRIVQGPTDPNQAEAAAAEGPEKYREILAEVKTGGVGDNKNVLLELNIESTRHHEIQLIGNGQWCLALGGRDCSVQMHEQKLLEISLTQEALREEAEAAAKGGRPVEAKALNDDLGVLTRMEAEAERFGSAVRLDSASTFECIVEGDRHYFMEVNTRIQVEHRVTELCYALRFENPANPSEAFEIPSLVQAMALIARHKQRLPRPRRVMRSQSAVESRLNATDQALNPHAGGIVEVWSDPIQGEIRDDQGISLKNPDTGAFIRYRLAGAYDSNIALLVTVGRDRKRALSKLEEVLRSTKLTGEELATNLEFHYGLVNFFLSTNVYAKATTRFAMPYLTQVGLLKEEASRMELSHALTVVGRHHEAQVRTRGDGPEVKAAVATIRKVLDRKTTLLERPLRLVLDEPHVLSGWLSALRSEYRVEGGRVQWRINPVRALRHTYDVLNMGDREGRPAAQVIWDHDERLLSEAGRFYDELEGRLGLEGAPWSEVKGILQQSTPPAGFEPELWQRVQSAHRGHQLGLELFDLLPVLGERSGFYELRVEDDLSVTIPDRLFDPDLQARMRKVLVPPPVASGNEIVAVSGGMFYSREAPDRPPMIEVGQRFEVGQPLYIVEVMKMFNKVPAAFSGTITGRFIENDGTIVRKGQPLFTIEPDEAIVQEDPKAILHARQRHTEALMRRILGGSL